MNTAILVIHRNVRPTIIRPNDTAATRVGTVVPFRLTNRRRRLACHWHRAADRRLTCTWEADIGAGPAHLFAFVAKPHRHALTAA